MRMRSIAEAMPSDTGIVRSDPENPNADENLQRSAY